MSTYSDNLRIELIGTGTQAGNWGNTTNDNLATVLEAAIAGASSVSVISSSQALTYLNGPTTTASANQSVRAILILTTSTSANFAVYAPPVSKQYIVWNNSSYTATIYNSTVIGNTTAAGTGIAVPAGAKMALWSNGTNFYQQTDHLIAPTIASASLSSSTISSSTITAATISTSSTLSSSVLVLPLQTNPNSQAATTIYIGGAYEIVTAGTTDFTTCGAANNDVGTQFIATSTATGTGTVKYLSNGSLIWDSNDFVLTVGTGTDRVELVGLTNTQNIENKTLSNSALTTGNSIQSLLETATITGSAPTSTTNFDVLTQAVEYYTSDADTNFTLNIRGDGSTSLDSIMSTGQAVTIALIVTCGSTAYYPSALTIDGSAVTPKWQNGATPSAGYASSLNSYVYTIIKTGSGAFTVLASQTKFA